MLSDDKPNFALIGGLLRAVQDYAKNVYDFGAELALKGGVSAYVRAELTDTFVELDDDELDLVVCLLSGCDAGDGVARAARKLEKRLRAVQGRR